MTQSNIANGRRADRGFHYLSDINISIQNVDANLAWRNTLSLARRLVFMTVATHVIANDRNARVLALYPARALIQDQAEKRRLTPRRDS